MNPFTPSKPDVKFVTIEHGRVAFEVPAGWIEDSTAFATKPGPAPRPTLSLTRMTAAPDESLETTVARRLTESSPTLPLEVIETRNTQAAGHWGMEVVVTLATEDEDDLILQRMIFVRAEGAVWVLSGASTKKQGRGALAHFDHALATLRLPNARGGW